MEGMAMSGGMNDSLHRLPFGPSHCRRRGGRSRQYGRGDSGRRTSTSLGVALALLAFLLRSIGLAKNVDRTRAFPGGRLPHIERLRLKPFALGRFAIRNLAIAHRSHDPPALSTMV
ncbi:MAG: hypothetical protein ACK56I_25140, partial [bacterium]